MKPLVSALPLTAFALLILHVSSSLAESNSVEAQLDVMANKLVRLEAAITSGPCTGCAASLEVLAFDLHALPARADFGRQAANIKSRLRALNQRLDELRRTLDALPKTVAAQVVTSLAAKYGTDWETAARRSGSTCSTYVDALTGTQGIPDAQIAKALAEAVSECVSQGRATEGLAKIVCVNGGLIKTGTTTLVCEKPRTDATPASARGSGVGTPAFIEAPAERAAPSRSAGPPPVRTLSGWILSGLAGAALFGIVGGWVGNEAKPIALTNTGTNYGGGPPGAAVGILVGGLVGVGIYAALVPVKRDDD